MSQSINARVLQCGVNGYGTQQELIKAKHIIAKVKTPPKLIVVGYFMNDLIDDYLFPRYTASDGYLIGKSSVANEKTGTVSLRSDVKISEMTDNWDNYCVNDKPAHPVIARTKCWFTNHSILYNLASRVKHRLLDSRAANHATANPDENKTAFKENMPPQTAAFYYKHDFPWMKKAWETHFKNLKAFKKFAGEIKAGLLIVIIPDKRQVYYNVNLIHNSFIESV